MNRINDAFAHPSGALGWLAGQIMAIENRERNRWAISLLALASDDQVLEVGAGPGWALREMAKQVTHGRVVGVDASAVMVRQASSRNRATIRQGHMGIEQAAADGLPFEATTFDKALAVNSMFLWPDPLVGLIEMRRVLKPGGRIVIVNQPVGDKSREVTEGFSQHIRSTLSAAGFERISIALGVLKPVPVAGIAFRLSK